MSLENVKIFLSNFNRKLIINLKRQHFLFFRKKCKNVFCFTPNINAHTPHTRLLKFREWKIDYISILSTKRDKSRHNGKGTFIDFFNKKLKYSLVIIQKIAYRLCAFPSEDIFGNDKMGNVCGTSYPLCSSSAPSKCIPFHFERFAWRIPVKLR